VQLRHRSGPFAKPGSAVRRRGPHRRATYVLAGPLRWVEPTVPRALLRVDATNPAGRRFSGRTLTLDLESVHITMFDATGEHERLAAELAPGDLVTVRLRLPRHLAELPDVVHPRAVVALG
jgi:hypothetical protein